MSARIPDSPDVPADLGPGPVPRRPAAQVASTPGASAGLAARLQALADSRPAGGFVIRDLFRSLAGRGHAALVIVLSLPFCLPVPFFGLSTVFGGLLAFFGLRIAFGRRPWLPRWIMGKPVHAETLVRLADRMGHLEKRMHGILRPRHTHLCRNRWWHVSHGLTITTMALLLALPLPIPFSNLVAALPILILGLGLLEDDGLFVVLGYVVAWVGLAVFVALVWFSGLGLERFFESFRGG
jgi:hypothetical protein